MRGRRVPQTQVAKSFSTLPSGTGRRGTGLCCVLFYMASAAIVCFGVCIVIWAHKCHKAAEPLELSPRQMTTDNEGPTSHLFGASASVGQDNSSEPIPPSDKHRRRQSNWVSRFRCAQSTRFTRQQVALHATADDLWIVINGNVLDASSYVKQHPGGDMILDAAGGQDMAILVSYFHPASIVMLLQRLCIGRLHDTDDS